MKNQKIVSIWQAMTDKDLKKLNKLCYEDSKDYSIAISALRGSTKRGDKVDTCRVIDTILELDRPLFNPRSWRV